MRTTSYNDFSNNVGAIFSSVVDDRDTYIVNEGEERNVVLMSLEDYNAIMETLYIMSSPGTMADIRESERQIKEGRYHIVDLENL